MIRTIKQPKTIHSTKVTMSLASSIVVVDSETVEVNSPVVVGGSSSDVVSLDVGVLYNIMVVVELVGVDSSSVVVVEVLYVVVACVGVIVGILRLSLVVQVKLTMDAGGQVRFEQLHL